MSFHREFFSFFFEIIRLNKYELRRTLKRNVGSFINGSESHLGGCFRLFAPKFLRDLRMVLGHSMNASWMLGTLKPNLLKSNLLERFALTGSGDAKPACTRATWRNFHYLIFDLILTKCIACDTEVIFRHTLISIKNLGPVNISRVSTRPGKPGKMRVHLENLEIWNFEKFNKYHGKMTWNLEKLGGY